MSYTGGELVQQPSHILLLVAELQMHEDILLITSQSVFENYLYLHLYQ